MEMFNTSVQNCWCSIACDLPHRSLIELMLILDRFGSRVSPKDISGNRKVYVYVNGAIKAGRGGVTRSQIGLPK